MDDAVTHYQAASQANDIDALMETRLRSQAGAKIGRHPGIIRRALGPA